MEKLGIDIRFKRKSKWSEWYRVSNPSEIDKLLKNDDIIISYTHEGVTIEIPKTNTPSNLPLKIKTQFKYAFYSFYLLNYLEIKEIEIRYSINDKDFIDTVYSTRTKKVDDRFLGSTDDYTNSTPVGNESIIINNQEHIKILKHFMPTWSNCIEYMCIEGTPIITSSSGGVDASIFGFDFKPDSRFKFKQRGEYRDCRVGKTLYDIKAINSCEYEIDIDSIVFLDEYRIQALDKQFKFTEGALKTLKVIKKYIKRINKGYILESSCNDITRYLLQIGSFYLLIVETN